MGCFVDTAVLNTADGAVLKNLRAGALEVVTAPPIRRQRALGALARSDMSH